MSTVLSRNIYCVMFLKLYFPNPQVCNKEIDCYDGEDERGCTVVPCEEDYFTCTSGQCIPDTLTCDHIFDCEDKSDEGGHCSQFTFLIMYKSIKLEMCP